MESRLLLVGGGWDVEVNKLGRVWAVGRCRSACARGWDVEVNELGLGEFYNI